MGRRCSTGLDTLASRLQGNRGIFERNRDVLIFTGPDLQELDPTLTPEQLDGTET